MISGYSPEDNRERRGREWIDMGVMAHVAVNETVSLEANDANNGNNDEENDNKGEQNG